MIILIRDIDNNHVDGAAATALLAGITSIGKSKKTLALQLNGFTQDSILNILYGKTITANSIRDVYSFTDDGLDALMLRAETNDLSKEHYDECTTSLLEKENMLDVLKPTGNSALKEFAVDSTTINDVIKSSEDVYDYIYVYIPMNEAELYSQITEYSDAELILVPQGRYPDIDLSNDKTNIVIKDFEETSRYDLTYSKKRFKSRKLYTIPHNVGFNDAILDNSLLDFILVNRNNIKTDDNYALTSSLWSLLGSYMTNHDSEDDPTESEIMNKPERGYVSMSVEETVELPEDSVQEVTVKKGFFKKENKFIVNL